MEPTSRSFVATTSSAIIIILLCSANISESRPRSVPVPNHLQGLMPDFQLQTFEILKPVSQYYPVLENVQQQGPRRRRWAFPVDVQNFRCPAGQKPHSSGFGCVPDGSGKGDYDDY